MKIQKFQLGRLSSNSYICYENDKAIVFDIGGEDIEKIVDFLKQKQIEPQYLVLTHGHIDHIEGLNKFIEYYPDIQIYIGEEDYDFLYNSVLNLSAYFGDVDFVFKGSENLSKIKEGDTIGDFIVIDTPGHTMGSKCFYNSKENLMITGDTIFRESIGRTDLPNGDYNKICESIRKILKYDLKTELKPGHGMETTIQNEINILEYY